MHSLAATCCSRSGHAHRALARTSSAQPASAAPRKALHTDNIIRTRAVPLKTEDGVGKALAAAGEKLEDLGPQAADKVDDDVSQKIADWIHQKLAAVDNLPQRLVIYFKADNGKGDVRSTYMIRRDLQGKTAEELLHLLKARARYDASTPITVRATLSHPPVQSMPAIVVASDREVLRWDDEIDHALQMALWWDISVC